MPHRFWSHIMALAMLGCVLATAAMATDQDANAKENYVKVPKHLQKKGYTLRLSDEDVPLEENKIALPESELYDAELLDSQDRIIDRGDISTSTLTLDPRNWLVGVSAGYVTPLPRSMWKKALLPLRTSETSFDANYRWSETWNAWGQMAFHSSSRNLQEGVALKFQSSRLLLGVAREWAPWGNHATSPLRSVHCELMGGLGYEETLYELADDYVSIKSTKGAPTAAMGGEVRIPMRGNLWLMVRNIGHVTTLRIDDLKVRGTVFLNSMTAGVKYAF